MLLLYRNGEHIPVQQVAKEFRDAASDAVDQKPVCDFLGIACARNSREALAIDAERANE